jgi:type I restriction enzyme S subunit
MPSWPIVRLEELASDDKSAISKPYGSAIVKEDYVRDGVPVVRGVNLARGLFHDDDFVYITEELADRMPGSRLLPGDLVFTHRGSVGQVSMVPRRPRYARYAVSTSQVKARLNPVKALAEFYYYWFRSPAGHRSILQGASTVGVPGLAQPVATIKALKVPVPSLDEQRGIATTLGALDDKIESNRHAIDLAERLADQLFADEIETAATLSDVATLTMGSSPPGHTYNRDHDCQRRLKTNPVATLGF